MASGQVTPQHNQQEYRVGELAAAIKRTIEERFDFVRIRGEISGYRGPHASGHCYFALKDDKAKIEAVIWKGTFARLGIRPEEGMEVIASGRVTTYPGKSNYQIVIESLEPAGIGALMALLEKRKKALAAEGLFAPERKKKLPFMPEVIGVVTSPTGAVIRDILHRIGERFPSHVLVWPVRVQGDGAAEEIAAAIRGFQTMTPRPDVLIVARGGGSIEDLWCFNEEIVVRATAASAIPLISAVGHETDTTLIDYAADRRAPTPTAAAEMAVPVRSEWLLSVRAQGEQLNQAMLRRITRQQERLSMLGRAIPNPARLLEFAIQRLDDWSERLRCSLPAFLERKSQQLRLLAAQHKPQPLLRQLQREEQDVVRLQQRLQPAMLRRIREQEERLTLQTKLFASLNYRSVLARGYALVRDADGQVIRSADRLRKQKQFSIMLQDGEAAAQPATASASKRASADKQAELF